MLLNNGSGAFSVGSTLTLANGAKPSASSLADFDNDHDLDLVIANRDTISLTFFANSGNGSYTLGATINSGGQTPLAVTTADFNADGFADVAVANNGTSSGSSITVHLNRGDATFLSAVTFSGGSTPVALNAADIDSDGALDLVVLNQSTNALSILLNTSATTAGTTSGQTGELMLDLAANGAAGMTIFGADLGDKIGSTLSAAGDVNGDGYDDFILGTPDAKAAGNAKTNAGESYVIFGGPTLPTSLDLGNLGSSGFVIYGEKANDLSGTSVSGAGDLNGDGYDDLVIGAVQADAANNSKASAGNTYVIFGAATFASSIDLAVNGAAGITIFGADSNDRSGSSVSSAGDVNGDGFDDLIIGAPRAAASGNSKTQAGESYLIFGSATLPTTIDLANLGSSGVTMFGADAYDASGTSVAGVGDLNGDGFDDIAIGSPTADQPSGANRDNAGEIHIVFGSSSFPSTIDFGNLGTRGFKVIGRSFGDEWGRSVSGAGDVNGDGLDDLLIGAPVADLTGLGKSNSGLSALIFGKSSFTADVDLASSGWGVMFIGAERDDQIGTSVSAAGDVNGDGFDDIVIGARYGDAATNSKTSAGESYVIFGAATLPQTIDLQTGVGTGQLTIFGADAYDFSGTAVSAGGDINGDGFDDLLIGALRAAGANNARSQSGETYVIFGRNLSNAVSQLGTTSSEALTGTSAAEVFVAGRGSDIIIGNGGADVIYVSEGNDIVALSDAAFRRIDGGNGFDTLRFDGFGMSLDFTTLADNKLTSIEAIDLRGSGANTVTLNLHEVFNLTDNSNPDHSANTLLIQRDSSDTVNRGAGWNSSGTRTINTVVFDVFTQGAATLLVQQPTLIDIVDFGDAPDTTSGTSSGNYQTLLANNGPCHIITATQASLLLGARVDGESNGTSSITATGDDVVTVPDDEDGVFDVASDLTMTVGAAPRVRLRATNTTASSATLYGWIDFNSDGVFDNSTERASITVPTVTNNGIFTLTFPTIPSNAHLGTTYARFRISSDVAAANSTGSANGGEVEDYRVTVRSRADGTVDASKTVTIASNLNGGPSLNASDRFGGSAASPGDIDGDGIDDLIVGAPTDITGGAYLGAVHVLLMNANGTVKSRTKVASELNGLPLLPAGSRFGSSIGVMSDLDGDGLAEVAVGAIGDSIGGNNLGAVYVLYLNSSGAVRRSTKIASGIGNSPQLSEGASFGSAVSGIGDLDGDGIDDIAVGAYREGNTKGALYVCLMNSDGSVKSSKQIANQINGGPTLNSTAAFGTSVVPVDDLDGDGVIDLAVGALFDDSSNGAVYVLFMRPDGTVKSTSRIGVGVGGGPTSTRQFGSSLAVIGDLNGDGINDLGVGASYDGAFSNRGAIFEVLLRPDGTALQTRLIGSGVNGGPSLPDNGNFGTAIATLGPADSNGLVKLAVGVTGYPGLSGGSRTGGVYVLSLNPPTDFGDAPDPSSATGIGNYQTLLANNGPRHDISATMTTMFLGSGVDGEPDATPNTKANGDDLKTSADEDGVVEPARDLVLTIGTAPKVRVRATNLTTQPATLSGWIDFNRDGIFDNATERATVVVPTGTDKGTFTLSFPTIPFTASSGLTFSRFRLSSDTAAVNSTGAAIGGEVEDYSASISGISSGAVTSSKSIKIAHGTNGGPTLANEDNFGEAVTGIGDLNADGVPDMAVGALGDSVNGLNRGAVYVQFMNANGTVKSRVKIASSTNGGPSLLDSGYFGTDVAALGDIDEDGVMDLVVGAQSDSTGGTSRGALYVVRLNSDGTVKSSIKLSSGNNGAPTLVNGDNFGVSVTPLGDLDGDGVPDMAVGAHSDDTGGTNRGAVYVLLLNRDGTIKARTKIASGVSGGPTLADGSNFGTSLASLGDIDGDGVTDLGVGSFHDATGGANAGAVHVLFLNANGTVKGSTKLAAGQSGVPIINGDDNFGSSLATLGDLDGDGITELAVGGSRTDSGGPNRGAINVLFLNSNGTVKKSQQLSNGVGGTPTLADGDAFGSAVSAIGDLNGDGLTELAVGANFDDTGGTNRGAVHVLFLDKTLVVNSTLDKPDLTPGNGIVDTGTPGEVTLRAAVMEANAMAGFQEIYVPAGTYTLSIAGRSEDLAATGDLDVASGGLRIRGAGIGQTVLDGGKLDRLLQVKAGASLEVEGVTLRNGDVGTAQDGGAIDSEGTLTITDSELSGNSARSAGAIYLRANSALTLNQSKLQSNIAAGTAGLGGAIATQVTNLISINIVDSQLLNNRAVAGGGAIYTAANLNIVSSTFNSNQVVSADNGQARGGAIFNDDNTTLSIVTSTFSQNVAQTSGASGQANGGAISSDNGSTLTIDRSTFDGNQSIGTGSTANRIGGALASRGGGLIQNSTFSGNMAITGGGAIHHQIGNVSLNSVTVAANQTAGSGGGLSVIGGSLSPGNSLIATNIATTSNPDVSGAFSSGGHNLMGLVGTATGFTSGVNGDLVGTSVAINPMIGPLADNGGPTKTHALLVTQSGDTLTFSPAVDAGDDFIAPATDQRGLPRVVDGDNNGAEIRDIGAFELPLNRRPTFSTSTLGIAENSAIGSLVGLTGASDPDGNLASVVLSGADSAAFMLEPGTYALRTNTPLDFETKPSYSVTVTATDTAGLFKTQVFTINLTNVNETPFVVGSGFDDRTRRDGDAADVVDLRTIFGDPDAGTTLIFSIPQNSNTQLVNAQIVSGNQLSLTYLPYAANQNRAPSQLRIRATDGSGLFAEDTFLVSVNPRGTFEYALVVTRDVTSQPTLNTLPTSLTSVRPNEDFFVEVWVRDLLVSGRADYLASLSSSNATQGILSAGVDLNFDPLLSNELLVDASGSFSIAEATSVNAATGLIDNLHGDSPVPDPGTATQFGRLGAVKFRATGLGLQTFTLGLSGNESATKRQADGVGNGIVHPSQIALGQSVTVGVDPEGGAGATRLFDRPVVVPLPIGTTSPMGLALADFDGRGGVDLATANQGSNTASVLLNAPGLGRSVTLSAGDVLQNVNFGNRALPGEIHGSVYRESDNIDGQSVTELGPAGWTVYLDANQNGMFDADQDGNVATVDPEPTRVTDARGEFAFTNLLSLRQYRVGVVVQSGYLRSFPTTNGGLRLVDLDAGQSKSGISFGVTPDIGGVSGETGISGYVYRDADNDRVRDVGEGLSGMTVYLDLDNDGQRDNNEPTATTRADAPLTANVDEAGLYEFLNTPAGTYQLRVDTTGTSGMRQTSPLGNNFSLARFTAGGGPQAVALGNFNGDTQPDLAVANEDTSNVSLLLKSGATFSSSAANDIDLGLRRGFGAFAIVPGDFNGDHVDDLAVVNTFSRNVSVLLNSSTTPGTFAPAVNYNVGLTPRSLIAVDVDGVNGLDLITTNELGNSVSVLKNNGNGTFAAAVTVALGTSPYAITAVNLTGDSKPELVVTLQDTDQVVILNNDGSGAFTVGAKLAVGSIPLAVTAADFNHDTKPDLAVSNFGSSNVSVLLNNGSGGFNAAKNYAADAGPGGIAAVDLNRDSHIDLAVTHQLADGQGATDTITLLRNDGTGQFLSPENAGVADLDVSGAARFSIISGDVDGDQVPDIIVADKDSERVSVLSNQLIAAAATVRLTSEADVTTGTNFTFDVVAASNVTINLTTNQKVVVQTSGGNMQVLINDVIDPQYSTIAANNVQSITINGGIGANLIDLRGVTAAAFSRVGGVSVVVSAGTGSDTVFGSELADSILGGDGDDSIDGGAGNDTLDGGLNNDALTGGAGNDSIIGGTGTDTLIETNDRDMTLTPTSLVVAQGMQTLATDTLNGISKASLTGGPAANIITASTFVPGTNLIVTLTGGGGADVITGTNGKDLITANSTVGVTVLSGSGNDSVITGTGNDNITTSAGADSVLSGDGFDTVFGGTGNDTIDGGAGNDQINGQDNDDSIIGGTGNDRLTGDVGNDTLRGGIGDDTLKADAGIDSVVGEDGNDSLMGGDGGDFLDGGLGVDVLRGEAGADTMFGGAGNDTLVGAADADSLDGGDDNDDVRGDFGNDTVMGGNGNDQLGGNAGDDRFDGGAGTDFISEAGDTDVVVTGLNFTSVLFGTDTTLNVERLHLNGGPAANKFDARLATVTVRLFGNDGNDTLLGGSKVDSLVGGNGDDVLSGGASNDVIDGGAGNDFFYEKSDANVTINGLQVTSTTTGTETLIAIERIALVGGDSANKLDAALASIPVILIGGRGNDTLIGGNLNDVLIGGSRTVNPQSPGGDGTDSLTGGTGTDTYDNDPLDTRPALEANETATTIAAIFAGLPSWLDQI